MTSALRARPSISWYIIMSKLSILVTRFFGTLPSRPSLLGRGQLLAISPRSLLNARLVPLSVYNMQQIDLQLVGIKQAVAVCEYQEINAAAKAEVGAGIGFVVLERPSNN